MSGAAEDSGTDGLRHEEFTEVEITSRQELHDWLLVHHRRHESVWLLTWKKATPTKHVTHDDVLDELVAFGWTDGTARRVDEHRTRQLVSPRRTPTWARSYKVRAERLLAQGLMQPAGLASVRLAQESGGWNAQDDVDDLLVPEDLAAALADRPPAAEQFAGFPPSTRRNILRWIAAAKTAPTRRRRVERTAGDAQVGVRVASNG